MRHKERHGLVAPVVHQAFGRGLRIELKHGQELHRGDAQILQVGNFLDQPGVSTALRGRDTRTGMMGKSFHMELVYHRLGKRPLERHIVFPVVAFRIGDDALHGCDSIVAGARSSPAIVCVRDGKGDTVRVKQHLLAFTRKSTVWLEGTVCAIGIQLTGLEAGHEGVPVVISAVLIGPKGNYPRRLRSILVIEQEQFNQRRSFRENAEIDTAAADTRAKWSARTGCYYANVLRERDHWGISAKAAARARPSGLSRQANMTARKVWRNRVAFRPQLKTARKPLAFSPWRQRGGRPNLGEEFFASLIMRVVSLASVRSRNG